MKPNDANAAQREVVKYMVMRDLHHRFAEPQTADDFIDYAFDMLVRDVTFRVVGHMVRNGASPPDKAVVDDIRDTAQQRWAWHYDSIQTRPGERLEPFEGDDWTTDVIYGTNCMPE